LPQKQMSQPNAANEKRNMRTTKRDQESLLDANVLALLESLAQPVGTFGGTEDRIVRIRNGQIVPANSGNQGGGQN
jgi:hypothetical protein